MPLLKSKFSTFQSPTKQKEVDESQASNVYTNIGRLRKLQFQARGFNFTPKQAVNSILAGKYTSKLRGRGLNFEELRHYRPGDDIRCMDWKVTRRTGKPHIKVFTEERERNVYLTIDQRSSMFFGSTGKMKSVIAAELAALIAWKIVDSGDRIGALIFNDSDIAVIKPKRGHQHVIHLLNEVVKKNNELKNGYLPTSPSESYNRMLKKLTNISGHNALIIQISDGYGWNTLSTDFIKRLRQHNEVVSFDVFDPLERQLPQMSEMIVSDGQYQIQFSSNDRQTQEKYVQDLEQELSAYKSSMKKNKIPTVHIDTINPVEQQIRKAFGQVHK